MKRLPIALLVATVVTTVCGGAAAADFYYRRSAASVPMPTTGGVPTTVISVTVPAGTWVIQGKAALVNFGAEDYARCTLMSGTTVLTGSATMNGYGSGQPAVASIANAAVVTIGSSKAIKLSCVHDFNVAGEYVDADATLVITRAPGTQ